MSKCSLSSKENISREQLPITATQTENKWLLMVASVHHRTNSAVFHTERARLWGIIYQ